MSRWGVRAGRVFDGERFVDRPTVLVEGNSVVAVGEALPESVDVVDLGAATVLPGLVDTHQHLVFDGKGGLEDQVVSKSDDELTERARSAARRALVGGVTTLRDLGDRNYVTLGLRGEPDLARIVASGPPITPPGGHCWYLGGECAADDLSTAVASRAERGTDVIKIMVTGGALTPGFPLWELQFSPEQIRGLVDDAHQRGLPVAAHCHGVRGIEVAADVGVDSIEHCSFFDAEMRSVPTSGLLAALAEKGIAISATLGATSPQPYPPKWAAAQPIIRSAFGAVHDAGGVVVVGTDAGINELKPHDVLPHAFEILRTDVGMSPIDALRSITSAAAAVAGMRNVGRLRTGASADLIAIEGDPTVDLTALTSVSRVWKSGSAVVTNA